jgi:catechol 2,3-dioxygenase-like lactoylglutathione lyase family enzyme
LIANVAISVTDLKQSGEFYDALLTPLGWRRHLDDGRAIGWGQQRPRFVIMAEGLPQPGFGQISIGAIGIAAIKASWEAVDNLGTGTTGELGEKPRFGPGPYAAYVTDPDGYRIELTVAAE